VDIGKRVEYDSQDNSGPEQTPDTSDTSLKQHFHDEHSNKKTIGSADKEKKSKLFNRDKQNTNKEKERKVSSGNASTATSNVQFNKERSMSSSKDVESSVSHSSYKSHFSLTQCLIFRFNCFHFSCCNDSQENQFWIS